MRLRTFIVPVLAILVGLSLFGVFALMTPMHADMGCPFTPSASLCAAPLQHINHWKMTLAVILAEVLACAIGFLMIARFSLVLPRPLVVVSRLRYVYRSPRPTLFQELFSQGILNRKEPYGIAI